MKKPLSIILLITMLLSMGTLSFAGNTSDGTSLAPPSGWAKESVDKAKSLKIINADAYYHYDMSITREEFCEIIYNLIDIAGNVKNIPASNPFSDTKNPKIYSLSSIGIINGKSATEFAPKDFLTREEAATIIVRMVNKLFPMMATLMWYEYDDNSEISDWAMNSVQTISNLGFMKGVGNNRFAPKDTYTAEEAIVTVVRVYDAVNSNQSQSISFSDKLNETMPDDKNYMFSPLSIKMALMMAANGASGETLKEILSATDVADTESYNSTARAMIDKYKESDILNLNVANSIWINSDKTTARFSKAYEDLLKASFDASSGIVTDKDSVEK